MCLWGCDGTLGTLAPGGGSGLTLILWEVVFFFLFDQGIGDKFMCYFHIN